MLVQGCTEEGCQGSLRLVKMFEVQEAVRYSFYWPIVEFYGQDIWHLLAQYNESFSAEFDFP